LLFPDDMTGGLGREEGIKSSEKEAKWTMKTTDVGSSSRERRVAIARQYQFEHWMVLLLDDCEVELF
jgi:hypothetical protein